MCSRPRCSAVKIRAALCASLFHGGLVRVCNVRRLFSRFDIKTNGLDARTQFAFKYNCKYKHMNK